MEAQRRKIAVPLAVLFAVTRAALGVGVGLLVGPRLSQARRKGVGWTLFGIGVLSTIPLALIARFGEEGWSPLPPSREPISATPAEAPA